jgi:hypothetical protein
VTEREKEAATEVKRMAVRRRQLWNAVILGTTAVEAALSSDARWCSDDVQQLRDCGESFLLSPAPLLYLLLFLFVVTGFVMVK